MARSGGKAASCVIVPVGAAVLALLAEDGGWHEGQVIQVITGMVTGHANIGDVLAFDHFIEHSKQLISF